MNAFSIGTSALAVGQRGLDIVGQNIANASTPGYRRQSLNLASRSVGASIGVGVEVTRFIRADAPSLRTAVLAGNSQQSKAETQLDIQKQIETALGDAESSIGTRIEAFFNGVEQATSRPADTAVRREILSSATSLAGQFNNAAGDIDRLRSEVGRQIDADVAEVNRLTSHIADLNGRISAAELSNSPANDLKDLRDQSIDDLSKKIDFRTVSTDRGIVNVIGPNAALVVSGSAIELTVGTNPNGDRFIAPRNSTTQLNVRGGSLGGLLQNFNEDIPTTRDRLDGLAAEFARRVDSAQATGLGLNGPITSAIGSRGVGDPNATLATQNLPIAPQAGTLVISVTDVGANTRTSSSIAIDPATQSLNDVAAAIATGTGGRVQASVNPLSNALEFQAQTGFAFDFSGRPNSPPAGQFDPPAVLDTDTAGILAATGVNSLFRGSRAGDLSVRPELLANPNLLAASRSGRSGDGTNLERLAVARDAVAFGGTRTTAQEFSDIALQVGGQVRELDDFTTSQAGIVQNLTEQEQSIVGIDVNEQLLSLLDYQRMVQSASKYLSVVNSALDSILQIVS